MGSDAPLNYLPIPIDKQPTVHFTSCRSIIAGANGKARALSARASIARSHGPDCFLSDPGFLPYETVANWGRGHPTNQAIQYPNYPARNSTDASSRCSVKQVVR